MPQETMRCTSGEGDQTLWRWDKALMRFVLWYQVQQMKSQKRDEETLRGKEKAALAKEVAAR